MLKKTAFILEFIDFCLQVLTLLFDNQLLTIQYPGGLPFCSIMIDLVSVIGNATKERVCIQTIGIFSAMLAVMRKTAGKKYWLLIAYLSSKTIYLDLDCKQW